MTLDADRLAAFKRNERTRAGRGAKEATVAMENAHRRDMERDAVFRAQVRTSLHMVNLERITPREALDDITLALRGRTEESLTPRT